jgi:predicted ATPase
VGKTTVAVAVAHEAAVAFQDGAWFVDLATVDDPAHLAEAVASALGLTTRAVLSAHLRERKLLLVLDNCEHLIDGVASFAHRLLSQAPSVRILTTSREPLCMQGERVRRISGLGTPPPSSRVCADSALNFAAVQLFVEHARRRSQTFALNDENAAIVAELCRRVDGIALAVERLATRVDTLDLVKMLEHVENRRHLLDDSGTGPERHRTLTAAVDWSYRLLSESEQAVMRRLSLFVGPFTLESACAVGTSDGAAPFRVVEDVAALASKSLLVVELIDGKMSYRQAHVTRAFALEMLIESGELARTRRRHAEHFLEQAERDQQILREACQPHAPPKFGSDRR